MSGELEKMAEEINQRLNGWDCFAMSLWGGLPFQPTENIFKLLSTRVDGGSLILRFRHDSGRESELQLWKPANLTISDEDELIIKSVERLRWGNSIPEGPPLEKHSDTAVKLGFGRWPA